MKKLRPWLFVIGGALTGLAAYRLFPCTNGCVIRSSPYLSMAYMGFIGWLLSEIFRRDPGKNTPNS